MVILIAGETHTGKTLLAQKLLEAYRYPCLSLDHLKMGLIRSGRCALSPESDDAELTRYLWPIVREMIKTCIENRQNMIIEGCYIPFGWEDDFPDEYRKEIAYVCLVFSEGYIKERYADIAKYESVIENSKQGYYLALRQTQQTLRTDNPNWQPWLVFFFRALQQQMWRLKKKIEHEHMLITKLPALSLQILEYTREHGRATVSELVTLTGVSRNTIRKYLYNLVASNYLELVGRGRGSWYKIK